MSSRKNWQLAYSCNPQYFNDEKLKELSELGIRSIEVSDANYVPYFKMGFVDDPLSVVQMAEKHGISIGSIHLPFAPHVRMDPSNADEECHYAALTIQKTLIKAAGKAGIKIAVIHPSSEPYEEVEREERLNRSCEYLKELTAYAKECGVTLALENLPRTCLCRTSDEMLEILNKIPDLRVCFDTNHSLIEDNCDYIRAVGSKIITLHVSDYDFVNERHWLPSEGKNDWEAIFSVLEEVGYEGRFLYEVGSYTFADVAKNYAVLFKQ